MILQECQRCHVKYHNECYGRGGSCPRESNHICLACQARGTTVKGRTRQGVTKTVTIPHRPTECALCGLDIPVSVLPLAMHPLYDHHGVKGRPLLLDEEGQGGVVKKPVRAAWCHTLCAMFINTYEATSGCVFGCRINGDYEGIDSEVDDDDDDLSINSQLVNLEDDDDDDDDDTVHHFVFVLHKNRRRRRQAQQQQQRHSRNNEEYSESDETDWTRAIREHQGLSCIYCGKNDAQQRSFLMAVQCCANANGELVPGCHPELYVFVVFCK